MGVDHAAWAILGAVIRDTEEPEFRSFVVPRRDLEIDPGSWEVTGLRGAGSGQELPGLPDRCLTGRRWDRWRSRPDACVPGTPCCRAPFKFDGLNREENPDTVELLDRTGEEHERQIKTFRLRTLGQCSNGCGSKY